MKRLSLAGLAVGVLGLVIQWIADPGKFPVFPPGIIVIVACAGLVVAVRRWWSPVFAVLIALWILLGGLATGQLTPNLTSSDAGTVAGNVVMSLGLAVAAVTGVAAMAGARRVRTR
ncbi:hypothetical protein [Actinoplanes sp. N902-109]|uniref:hypothetical protein n=1 Tax=Actinoplanes sp. (strain N902-109) TaxID=649831 RepID=UPI0003295F0B|nr:hypothetical protein [Actinoplanes sp. N902-109]AGL17575.1 hypothetical protein L083_4065 [Actinoplanes sp. N902-109]